MGILKFGDSKTSIGVDIGNNSIRAAQIDRTRDGLELSNYGSIGIPRNAIIDGEIEDMEAISSALTELWKTMGFKLKEVTIGVANQKVIIRLVDLPYMDPDDLAGAISYQAQDYIAIPVDEAVLDFNIQKTYVGEDERSMMDVLLVAAQRDMVLGFIAAVNSAGLDISRIDVAAFALIRALADPPPVLAPEDGSSMTVIMDIGQSVTNMVVTEGFDIKFARVIPIAGQAFTDPLVETFHVTADEAEKLKIALGLLDLTEETSQNQSAHVSAATSAASPQLNQMNGEVATITRTEIETLVDSIPEPARVSQNEPLPVEQYGHEPEMGMSWQDGQETGSHQPYEAVQDQEAEAAADKVAEILSNPAKVEQARMLIEQRATQFSEEVRRSLDYFSSQSKSSKFNRITLTGAGSKLKNLDRFIAKSLQMEVAVGDPFKYVEVPEKLRSVVEQDKLAIPVCIGLALGSF